MIIDTQSMATNNESGKTMTRAAWGRKNGSSRTKLFKAVAIAMTIMAAWTEVSQQVSSMARHEDNSAVSSFSILLADAPHLDKRYTIFGRVVYDSGSVETIDRILQDWPHRHAWILRAGEL